MPDEPEVPVVIEGLGKRLSAERRRLGYNQDQFADAAGIKRTSVGFFERGVSPPNTNYLSAWSQIGVDLIYVLFGVRAGHTADYQAQLSPEALEQCFEHFDQLEQELGQRLSAKARATILHLVLTTRRHPG